MRSYTVGASVVAIRIFFAALFFILPQVAVSQSGSVLINEVAWMGTKANSADEWVELYNPTGSEVDVTNWNLYEAGSGTRIIILSGKIAPGGYYLIERTDDNTVSDVAADVLGSFGGSGLNNGGEYLVLKNADGLTIDSLDASSGWPGGDNTTKASLERKPDGSWQTNNGVTIGGHDAQGNPIIGTPKSANSQLASASLPPPPVTTGAPPQTGSTASYGATSASTSTPTKLMASAGPDFSVELSKEISLSAASSQGASSYKWYLGDGSVKEGLNVQHRYNFPGTYIVTLEASNGQELSLDQLRVYVFSGKILINELLPKPLEGEQWLEFYNPNTNAIDLGGWLLETDTQSFSIPSFTIVPARGFLVLSQSATRLDLGLVQKVRLRFPNGSVADEVSFSVAPVGQVASRAGNGFLWQDTPTPGAPNTLLGSSGVSHDTLGSQASVVLFPDKRSSPSNPITGLGAVGATDGQEGLVGAVKGGFWDKLFSALWFWVGSVAVLGVMVSVFYLWLRMKYQNKFFNDASGATKIKK